MDKKLKDPIYGYINIPVDYMKKVIDTAVFQRLRRITQTSYAPLYASAVHNRFVHSIGVFYLGSIVAEVLVDEIVGKGILKKEDAQRYADTYRLACLLHDVGHAPFSHTGEVFYKTEKFSSAELHKELEELVDDAGFTKDIPVEESKATAPHEIMSCIVGIRAFPELLADGEAREFFARCITGYRYTEVNEQNDIKNCFVDMLNSKVIDVDRLDYLIRDAYITGFESVNIDYERLLRALTIVCSEEGRYQIAYRKDALSVIENVVYAHDCERKWIQNHPVVLYEGYLLRCIMQKVNDALDTAEAKLFSKEALSREGVKLKNGVRVSLLCDDDVMCLYKNYFADGVGMEFFERKNRRHPVWKSEAEYKAYISQMSSGGKFKEEFLDCLNSFIGGNKKDMQFPIVINKKLEKKLEEELKESQAKYEMAEGRIAKRSLEQQMIGVEHRLRLCRYLVKYAEDNGLEDDFIVVKASMFNSSFSKDAVRKLLIVFNPGEDEVVKPISEVCPTLQAEKVEEDFYYLFYRGNANAVIRGKETFCDDLYRAALGMDRSRKEYKG